MEAVHLIRKGRVRRVAKHDSLAQGTIHFHLVWRGNLTQTSDFALLLGRILLIKDFRNETSQTRVHELIDSGILRFKRFGKRSVLIEADSLAELEKYLAEPP